MHDPTADPDARYARGEITREEWMRLKAPSPGNAPSPPAPAPMAPPRSAASAGRTLFLLVVAVVVIAVVAAFLLSVTQSGFGWNPTYAEARQLQVGDLASLNASATQGRAFMGNNTLWFGMNAMTLVVYGSPSDHDMAFVVQGMVNPTVHLPTGAHVSLTMVNMDSGEYHTWSMTTRAPPYSSSGMMGGGMMSGTMMGTSSLAPMSSQGMWSQQMGFTAQAGSYWYVCAVSNHAASGMYGQLVVG